MSERPKKDVYRVFVEQIHPHIFPKGEVRPKYKIDVTRLAFKSGKTWSDIDYSYTRRGAKKAAKKIIKNHEKEEFKPMVVDRYEIEI